MNLELEKAKKIVEKSQSKWAMSILEISKAYQNGQDYKKLTEKLVDNLYAVNFSKILFKPTKASVLQFRKTREEMISYFSAYNNVCTEDKGFAIDGWKKIRFENSEIITLEKVILAMGNYFFAKDDNIETKVEYTFGYIRDDSGNYKISLHHSSIPYKEI